MSSAVIPVLTAFVLIYGMIKKVNVYEAFVKGALEALPMLLKILPYMAAMMIVISLLNAGGVMNIIGNLLEKPAQAIGMPGELVPLILLRPFSGSAALAIAADLFTRYGADSMIGLMASTMVGSTETIFYTLALYFGSVGIQKTRFTIPVALVAGLISIMSSVLICRAMFG